ncbi:MAG: beta-glucuronidase [Prevotella sp.]|nr:beta-glucuronidase [Prevotella sp.]
MIRKTILCALCACALLSANAQNSINLAGKWNFAIDRENSSTPPTRCEETINLPGSMLTNGKGDPVTPETKWVGSLYDSSYYFNPHMEPYRHPGRMKFPFFLTPDKHYVGAAWYTREVTTPKSWKGKLITLHLERPHIETTVYVNGREAGHQLSLSAPHQYDLTDYLRPGKKDVIAIKVYNGIENVCVGQDSHSVTDQTQGDWNGIAGRITLDAAPLIHRKRVETDIHTATARILINDTTYTIHLPQPLRLWSADNPQLYTVKVCYQGDSIPVTFGMREVAIKGRQFLLNDQPIWFRGTVENCCFPETGYPPTDVESWLKVFGKCKEYGLNHVRFHSYCPPEAAFIAADQLGLYLQPEGPSWPNHGVRLRRGMPIDQYLVDECKRIIDTYGSHPSLVMLAAGNEPAGDWVPWGADFCKEMKAYDPSRVYCTASVGGGWAWDAGSEYHVKGGARGLEWDRHAPQSTDNFDEQVRLPRNFKPTEERPENTEPYISHEQGQWCVFPDFKEIPQYTGAYKAGNLEIFRDLLRDGGMASQAEKFLMSSGKLQTLAYKYEIERNLRSHDYAGFQILSLNDYSGQGTALVGVLNVHWGEKGYCTSGQWREFCSDIVPMALFPRFVFTTADTLRIGTALYNTTLRKGGRINYLITGGGRTLAQGDVATGETINYLPSDVAAPEKLTLTLTAMGHTNHYEFWVYPDRLEEPSTSGILVTDTLDDRATDALRKGGKVLLCAAGKVRHGNDVSHHYLPVFWNTSWFKMRPPHTTGAYIDNSHPVFEHFPTDDWQNLNWWELVNRTQVMNLAEFPVSYQPIVQPIDTWHISRKLGMLVEANVLGGKLMMTTIDLQHDLDHRPVARQLRHSILQYMQSDKFQPAITIAPEVITHLYEKEAPRVDMFTKDSPDELKPKLK